MANVLPRDLTETPGGIVNPNAAAIVDDGSGVWKATPEQIVDAGAPVNSQGEAEAGLVNTGRMTPLRVSQAIDALGVSQSVLASSSGASQVGTDSGGNVQAELDRAAQIGRGLPRFLGKLQAYRASGSPLDLPTYRIEGDSIADGAGSSSGNTKPYNMLFGIDNEFALLPGRVGESCSIPNIFMKPGGSAYAISVLRYAIAGATSATALSRLVAHEYQADTTYSQLDTMVTPNAQHVADLVSFSYSNNDFTNPTWPRMLWFLEECIRACLRAGQDVLIHIPHDRAEGTAGSRTLDRDAIEGGQDSLVALATYYNLPVLNMRDRFRQLVDDGIQTVEDLFPVGDNIHTSDLGLEYETAEFLSLLPDANAPVILAPIPTRLPPRLYRQNGFLQKVNRWKNMFKPTAATVAGVVQSDPFTPTTAYVSASYPTNTRAMFGKNDGYYLLSQSGDKVEFRAAAGSRVIIGCIKQASAGEADVYVENVFVETITFAAESVKEYAFFSSTVTGGTAGNKVTATVSIRWKSGSFGVSHICVGAPLSPGFIDSHPSDLITLTGTWSDSTTFKETTTQNDSIDIKFIGTGLFADMPFGTDYGIYTVEVDGVTVGTIDRYLSGTIATRLAPIVVGLTYGEHVVTLTNATKNASSSGYRIRIRNYMAIDERLDAERFDALTFDGFEIKFPEGKNGIVTGATLGAAGRIKNSAVLRYSAELAQ